MKQRKADVVVIGAGPAGLAAAAAASEQGARVLIIEREERPGGILKQCIHPGFGVIQFGEELTGPEYACRYIRMVEERQISVLLNTYLSSIRKTDQGFLLTLTNPSDGIFSVETSAAVFATGCRERTAKQIFLQGTRPAGVITAGLAQYFINIQGYLPGKRCVILGSGDIGLIMARRLTLEGAEVEGVYEILPRPSGLTRNIAQCLEDFSIPLHLSATVTEVRGRKRVEGVTVAYVDENGIPVPGTGRDIPCDTLILSVGLIPENDLLDTLHVRIDPATKGPLTDQFGHTSADGIFSCGNSLHVNDLVDYVSESGEAAGFGAARWAAGSRADGNPGRSPAAGIDIQGELQYIVPRRITLPAEGKTAFFFRTRRSMEKAELTIGKGGAVLFTKMFRYLKPPEMERFEADLSISGGISAGDRLSVRLEELA